jgi:hypothetical protein
MTASRLAGANQIVTSWQQGTSRDGDPQDHIHNQITRTARDGRWRALTPRACTRYPAPCKRSPPPWRSAS